MKEHNLMPEFSEYKKVWQGQVDDNVGLDDIYQKFNLNHPKTYTGHSLSVSDIVDLDGETYWCDSYGWERLEFTLRTKNMVCDGKEYEIKLTTREMDEIEREVRIAKLNGRTFEQCLSNATVGIRLDWPEVLEEVWNNREYQVEEGMGATMNLWSDRIAMTVTKVISPKKIEVRENNTVCKDWYASAYDILPELVGGVTVFTLRKNGTWVQEGQPKKFGSVTLTLGFRHHYIDPSF